MSDMGSARKAKDEVRKRIGAEAWCTGIGVEREDGVGFIVRVNVKPGNAAAASSAIGGDRLGGVLVKVIEKDD
jgi:hypothetical protein